MMMRKLTVVLAMTLAASCASSESDDSNQSQKARNNFKQLGYEVVVQSCGSLTVAAYTKYPYSSFINDGATKEVKKFLKTIKSLSLDNYYPRIKELTARVAHKDPEWMQPCIETMTRSFYSYANDYSGEPTKVGGAFISNRVDKNLKRYIALIGKKKKKKINARKSALREI
jgi:hypothetical protein